MGGCPTLRDFPRSGMGYSRAQRLCSGARVEHAPTTHTIGRDAFHPRPHIPPLGAWIHHGERGKPQRPGAAHVPHGASTSAAGMVRDSDTSPLRESLARPRPNGGTRFSSPQPSPIAPRHTQRGTREAPTRSAIHVLHGASTRAAGMVTDSDTSPLRESLARPRPNGGTRFSSPQPSPITPRRTPTGNAGSPKRPVLPTFSKGPPRALREWSGTRTPRPSENPSHAPDPMEGRDFRVPNLLRLRPGTPKGERGKPQRPVLLTFSTGPPRALREWSGTRTPRPSENPSTPHTQWRDEIFESPTFSDYALVHPKGNAGSPNAQCYPRSPRGLHGRCRTSQGLGHLAPPRPRSNEATVNDADLPRCPRRWRIMCRPVDGRTEPRYPAAVS
jgi:hypothetical protein